MKTYIQLAILFVLAACNYTPDKGPLKITYPFDGSIFPPEIPSPTIKWTDNQNNSGAYLIQITNHENQIIYRANTKLNHFKMDEAAWENIKRATLDNPATLSISYPDGSETIGVNISTSRDSVAAPIFYRSVPLPFKFARENLEEVSWHLGNVAGKEKAPAVLENLPVCGNCHSFSANGGTLAMDLDARDEKGAYVISKLNQRTTLDQSDIINWSDFQNGEFTYGLLSQISPNGENVVSTLKDCEIFVDLNNMEYSQLFFPFKGILAFYNKPKDMFRALKGADDSTFVHSNPAWSPCGKYIYFCRSKAAMFEESGVRHGSAATDHTTYNKFLHSFIDRKKLFKFDIYRIPFNDGEGGLAEPVKGASGNGKSNFFPKISPDGKWMVFTQAESFMLLQKDSRLFIMPAGGGEARLMNCNTSNMNSWHSWSPNSKWLVFSSKVNGPYTQLFLTHIDENGNDSPPILLENFIIDKKAANIPEFVNMPPGSKLEILPLFLDDKDFKLRMAQINAKKNKLDTALILFNQIIRAEPSNPDALMGRADIYMKKKMADRAFADFNKAIQAKPTVSSYYISRGSAFGDIQQPEKAIKDFNKAIELDPYSFMAYNNRGLVRFRMGKTDQAIMDYQKSLELNDRAYMTMVNLGAALAQLDKTNEAMQYFDAAVGLNPELAMAYNAKAILFLQTGKVMDALNNLNKALEAEPQNIETLSRRAKVLETKGDFTSAVNDYLQLVILTNNRELLHKIASICENDKDYKRMQVAMQALLQKQMYFDGEVYYLQALAFKGLGDHTGACEAITKSANSGYKQAKGLLKTFCN
jgi:tetratricopeptide (TPR) repeat protein